MKSVLAFLGILALGLTATEVEAQYPPRVTESRPAHGAADVPLDVGSLTVVFSRNMKMNSWTLQQAGQLPFPPFVEDEAPWKDPRTFVLKLRNLEPGVTYGIQLNGARRKGFSTAEDQVPLPVTAIHFTTASSPEPEAPRPSPQSSSPARQKDLEKSSPSTPSPQPAPPPSSSAEPLQPAPSPPPSQDAATGPKNGWRFEVTRSYGVKGAMTISGHGQAPLQYFEKLRFVDEVSEAQGSRILQVNRQVVEATLQYYDPEADEMRNQELAPPGSLFRVTHAEEGSLLYDGRSGEEVWEEDLVEAFTPPMAQNLWPSTSLAVGQAWSYEGAQLARRLTFIEPLGGRMDLKVERLEPQPDTGLLTAFIRGELKTRVDIGLGPLEFSGRVEIDLPLALGIPFMVKLDGTLSGSGKWPGEPGQEPELTVNAEATALQICKPSDAVLRSAGGKALPRSSDLSESPASPKPASPSLPEAATDLRQKEATPSGGSRTVAFQRVMEPRENAFSLLVPRGWSVAGGIVRVDPSAAGGPANAIEAKLDMAVLKDPAGTVMLRRFPAVYYTAMTGSPAARMGLFPPGSNYMGMTVYPKPSALDYLSTLLFPRLHPDARSVRVVESRPLPEMARKCQERAQAVPLLGVRFLYDAAVLIAEYDEGGARYREVLFTFIEDRGPAFQGQWCNRETFQCRAPAEELDSWVPVFGIIAGSVKPNLQWVRGEVRGVIERNKIAGATQAEIERIGREIAEHRRKTNAEIHNDMFLTLTGQEEYVNPYTGQTERDTDRYRHRWVNESGDIVLSNDESYDPNVDVHLNRSDYRRTAVRPRFGGN